MAPPGDRDISVTGRSHADRRDGELRELPDQGADLPKIGQAFIMSHAGRHSRQEQDRGFIVAEVFHDDPRILLPGHIRPVQNLLLPGLSGINLIDQQNRRIVKKSNPFFFFFFQLSRQQVGKFRTDFLQGTGSRFLLQQG